MSLSISKKSLIFLLLFAGFTCVSFVLFLYSYTQVDLNLTLSKVSVWQYIQKSFQYIGYYNRPLSTALYITILSIFFLLYFFALLAIKSKLLSRSRLWVLIFAIVTLLVLSYPAFSYDIFNYIFTAKTVALYHKNPYTIIPLDLAGVDPWVLFMRWTHLPSAYTPVWILLTIPAYIIGLGYLLPVLWTVKILVAIFYILTTYYIGKILHKVDAQNELLGIAIFALNPLVIIETLVSGHNDVVMMSLAVFSLYLYIQKKTTFSLFVLSLSVALKLMTIFLYPVYLFRFNRLLALFCMMVGFALVLTQRDVLPWYLVWIIPFVALVPRARNICILAFGASLGLMLRYVPYIYAGNWDAPVPMYENILSFFPILFCLVYICIEKRTITSHSR